MSETVFLVYTYSKDVGIFSKAYRNRGSAIQAGKLEALVMTVTTPITFEEKQIKGILYHAELSNGGYVRVEEIEIR